MEGDNPFPPVDAVPGTGGSPRTAAWDITFCAILAVAHVGLTFWLRPPCFETFDMAIAMDGGYRIYCGQLPYRDFHIPTGPVRHYALALCFAAMGGYSWSAAILCGGLIGAAASVLVYVLLRYYNSRPNAMLFAGLTALTFNLPVAFPWFDHLAYLWALVALTALATVQAVPQPSGRRVFLGAAISGVALTLAVMTKQNIGGAALVLVSLLWLVVPLPGRTVRTNRWAAACCAGAALASAAAIALYFQLQGDFLGDFFRSGSQMSRLAAGLGNLGADIAAWPEPRTIDVWTLLFALLYLMALRLSGVRLANGQRTMALLAGTALLITLAGRLTGSAPVTWFCGLSPLALGLLARGVGWPDPPEATVNVPPRLARTLAFLGGAVLVWLVVLTLAAVDWGGLEWEFDFAPQGAEFVTPRILQPPFLGTHEWLLHLAVAVYLLVHLFRLGRARQSVRLGLPSVARAMLFVAVAALASFYALHNLQRQGWAFSPACWGPTVPFTQIPALAGCEASPAQVADFEELYAWWLGHRGNYPQWRDGQDLYLMPFNQQFYGFFGVESFRNARLWYDPGLTYSGIDPDTDQLEASLPALIIVQRDGRPYQTRFWHTAGFLQDVPRLRRLMHERYEVLAVLAGFEVWGRKR